MQRQQSQKGTLSVPIPMMLILLTIFAIGTTPSHAVRLRFASPLQSLTIPDREVQESAAPSPRQTFLQKFRAGFQAEVDTRKKLAARRRTAGSNDVASYFGQNSDEWAAKASAAEIRRRRVEDAVVERAYDQAVARFDDAERSPKKKSTRNNSNKNNNAYQFVGVVGGNEQKAISWYARPKPSNANWSVRLVHINRNAIVKDLFTRGKVDIFASYKNTGTFEGDTNKPVVVTQYDVRPRTWRNLWNFSPKHFFTDPSGKYWRERRLRPGLYTDGADVYEASYRYRDGRNGMYRLSSLEQMMNSKTFGDEVKQRVMRRLREDSPDVVLEDL